MSKPFRTVPMKDGIRYDSRGEPILAQPSEDRLRQIAVKARLVSQWHDSIGSGPIEELNAELGELWELTHPPAAMIRPAPSEGLPEDSISAAEYERRVQAMAEALHEDCVLMANARYAVDPRPDPWQRDFHGASRHYGQAHDLVRRLLALTPADPSADRWDPRVPGEPGTGRSADR